jgi:hypothetical protein
MGRLGATSKLHEATRRCGSLLHRESIVKTYLPNHPVDMVPRDDFERRARLVCLVYEVLRSIETPADEATDMAILSDLTRAFSDRTIALANLEPAAPSRKSRSLIPT